MLCAYCLIFLAISQTAVSYLLTENGPKTSHRIDLQGSLGPEHASQDHDYADLENHLIDGVGADKIDVLAAADKRELESRDRGERRFQEEGVRRDIKDEAVLENGLTGHRMERDVKTEEAETKTQSRRTTDGERLHRDIVFGRRPIDNPSSFLGSSVQGNRQGIPSGSNRDNGTNVTTASLGVLGSRINPEDRGSRRFGNGTIGKVNTVSSSSSGAGRPGDQVAFNNKSNEGGIFFPDGSEKVQLNSPQEIPLSFIRELSDIHNVTDLLDKFVKDVPQTDFDLTSSDTRHNSTQPRTSRNFWNTGRFGNDVERKNAIQPKAATCEPEMVTVPLKDMKDPSVFYFPTCTRLERCGGCCAHELLSCQPTETEFVHFQVIKTEYAGGNTLSYKGKEIVTLEKHIKCKCDCTVKESDCTKFQVYRNNECRCECTNVDDRDKCYAENDTKLWDFKECVCRCREIKECTTGYYFDESTCGCTAIPLAARRRYPDKRQYVGRHEYTIIKDTDEDVSTSRSPDITQSSNLKRRNHKAPVWNYS